MALFTWPAQHPTTAGLIFVTLISLASYYAYSQYHLNHTRRAFKLRHGCQPQTSTLTGIGPFGLVNLYKIIKAKNNKQFLEFFHRRHAELGTTYINENLSRRLVITNDPENIKAALATKFEDWGIQTIRQGVLYDFLGSGIFTTDGAFWQHSRAMLRPQFEKSQVSAIDQFEPYVQKLISCIPDDGSTVDLQELFHKFTMDTSTDFLTGSGTDCLGGDKAADKFAVTFDQCLNDGIWKDMLGPLWYLTNRKKGLEAIKYAHASVEGWVKQAMQVKGSADSSEKAKGKGERYVFVNELARHEEVDATRIRDEALNIILAGRDTTASLLSDLWFMLAKEPEVFKKLKAEVDELNGEQPSYESLRNMKYIKYTVQETLRLFPPVPILGKLALKDTVLPHGGGKDGLQPLFVAKGNRIMYNSYSMMRQTSAFGPDATEFKPERWADPSLRPGWNYLPFGGGPRVCLGQQYALTETYYVTIRLIQRFGKLECRDPAPWVEKVSVTCCSGNGTKVALT